jgi:23S rRNA pseudouridine2605 synthase
MPRQTLLRAVIDATGLARRKAFDAIRAGRVASEEVVLLDPSQAYEGGVLLLDGKPIGSRASQRVYLLLNKPPDYITTVSDERGRRTVLDLVPPALKAAGLHPVGRLDRDTSGLLLLTNDGDLTYRLTHPKHEVEKEYWAEVMPAPTSETLSRLRRGVLIDGVVRRPLAVSRLADEGPFNLSMTIGEGRNRQARRMLDAVGLRVRRLRRVREGGLELGAVPEGGVRPLSPDEVDLLLRGSGTS